MLFFSKKKVEGLILDIEHWESGKVYHEMSKKKRRKIHSYEMKGKANDSEELTNYT